MRFTDYIARAHLREAAKRFPLTENKATYKQMMAPVLQALNAIRPAEAQSVSDQIGYYRKALGRSDRIIWALRWVRLGGWLTLSSITDQLPDDDRAKYTAMARQGIDKAVAEIIKGDGGSLIPSEVMGEYNFFQSSRFSNSLHHFMSYVDPTTDNYIKQIDEIVFSWQIPSGLNLQLQAAEKVWQDNRGREVPHAEDHYANAEKLIDFGDGFAWWNTNEQYCDAEGKSMGHCGNNSYMKKDGDQVLSLRQEISRNGERVQIPYLTFIMNADNKLGEMKGRANEKPAARYHKYIVALLRSKYVEGIKGGGYLPENNFSIYDLEPEVRNQLIAENPSLEPLYDKFKRLGPTREVMRDLYDEMGRAGLPDVYEIRDDKTVVLHQWNDLENLDNSIYFEPLSELLSYVANSDDGMSDAARHDHIQSMDLDENDVIDMFDYLPDEYVQRIADDIGITGPMDRRTKGKVAQYIDRSPRYADVIRAAFVDAGDTSRLTDDDDWDDYVDMVVNTALRGFANYEAGFEYDKADMFNTEIKMVVPLSNLFAYIEALDTAGDDDDNWEDDNYRVAAEAQNEREWTRYEADNANSDWDEKEKYGDDEEKALYVKFYKDMTAGDSGEIGNIDPRAAAHYFQKHVDYNEAEETTDDDDFIMEIKRRAGL